MTVLAIDTAWARLQIGLLSEGWTDTLVEDMAQGHAERIFPAIGELLARNGVGYSDLGRIAATTGPGSFTGLRIGLSAARGLGLALGIPVIGVPTLLALSLGESLPLTVLLDARRGEAYVQVFDGTPSQPVLLPADAARRRAVGTLIRTPFIDIARLARFAATADPAQYPPDAVYVRGADAKPQEAARIARVGA